MTRLAVLSLGTCLAFNIAACSDSADNTPNGDAQTDAGADAPQSTSGASDDASSEPESGQGGAAGQSGQVGEGGSAGSIPADAGPDADPTQACLVEHCLSEISTCMADESCSGWMECIQECGDDMMKCPTFCGLYYPSEHTNTFIDCALDQECMTIDFSAYPACERPTGDFEDLSGMDGTWWFAGFHGEPYLFDYDCQRLDFQEVNAQKLEVSYSVPLTRNAESKISSTVGTFEQQDDGSVLVAYETFLGYHEDWFIVHKSENVVLAHVCFASDGDTKNYGTLIISRPPLEDIDPQEHAALEQAIVDRLGIEFADFTPAGKNACDNAEL
jgi:VDE lipocalin domain